MDAETVWKAYRENLALVLPHVRELIEYVGQKTVVTADHGNLIDERVGPFPSRISGHPRGVHGDELVKVPWLVTERGPRKEVVTAEQPLSRSETSGDAIRRLRHLGYA